MSGDSLYYDRNTGVGRAIKNVKIIDTTQNITITGNLAIHYEKLDLSVVTGKALLIQVEENDTFNPRNLGLVLIMILLKY